MSDAAANLFQKIFEKMLHPDGIEVYIKSLDRDLPYVEYMKPGDSEEAGSKRVKRYIEVAPGERFSVVVEIKKGFDCRGQPHIQSWLYIDDGAVNTCAITRSDLLKSKNFTETFDQSRHHVGEKWVMAGFSFAELGLGKDGRMSKN